MRNALILTGMWLGILVTAYAIVFWDQGIERPLPISILEQQAELAAPDFVHSGGVFSMSVPMGWDMDKVLGVYVHMTDPNAIITVWIIATEEMDLDGTLAVAFSLLDVGDDASEFNMVSSVSLPLDMWFGDDVSMTYQEDGGDDVVSIRARRPNEWTVMMVARGARRDIEALTENLEWIWSELAIPANTAVLL